MAGYGEIIMYFKENIDFQQIKELLDSLKNYDDFANYQLTYKSDVSRLENWTQGKWFYTNELYLQKELAQTASHRAIDDEYYYFYLAISRESKKPQFLSLSGNSKSAEFYLTYNNDKLLSFMSSYTSPSTVKFIAGQNMNIYDIMKYIDKIDGWSEKKRQKKGITTIVDNSTN